MSFRDFEGRQIGFLPTDSIALALYRAGVRTFSRSFKYHWCRGLYSLTGDCPNFMDWIGKMLDRKNQGLSA